jgi:hypothetical protein
MQARLQIVWVRKPFHLQLMWAKNGIECEQGWF